MPTTNKIKAAIVAVVVALVPVTIGASTAHAGNGTTLIWHTDSGANTFFWAHCRGAGGGYWVTMPKPSFSGSSSKCGSAGVDYVQLGNAYQILKCKPQGTNNGATWVLYHGNPTWFPDGFWECWTNQV